MKRAIKLFMICLMMVVAAIATAQAQTKEETMAWLKEKLEKCGGDDVTKSHFTNVQVSPCEISYISHSLLGEANNSFNPADVKMWKFFDDKTGLIADTEVIKIVYCKSGRTLSDSRLNIRNREGNIHKRMIKALLHLATFCEEDKSETF